ncbi:MAG: alpha/beta fold hydrolase [Chloroflexi bacterium]|nr:alpha/beta fold hydrolase [Chloroflexota bacterium]
MTKLKIERLKLGDIYIAYSQYGDGSNLLLLHGNSGSKIFFKQYQIEHFAQYHTIALDSRGHGHSRSKDDTISYEQQSMDVLNFCEAKGITKTSVIGYSDGGNLALWLAVKAPEIFTKVVAISPNTLAGGSTEAATCAIKKALETMKVLRKFGFPNKKQIMRFELMLTDTGITDEDLQSIKTNVMILYAENDMITEEHILQISSQILGGQVKKINACNHFTIPFRSETIKIIKDYLW